MQHNQISNLINLTQKSRIENSKTKILTITSGKGGVGKSTISANLGYLISQKGYKVLMLDADIGLANLQVLYDIKPKYSMYDFIESNAKLQDVILQTKYENLSLIAGKSGYKYVQNDSQHIFYRLVDEIVALEKYDFVIIDTGAGLNEYVHEFIEMSHRVLAITSTDPSALTDLYALIKMISGIRQEVMLCFNLTPKYATGQVITKSISELNKKHCDKTSSNNKEIMIQYIGNINSAQEVQTTARLRKLFTKEFERSVATRDLIKLTNILVDRLKKS
jgi:flagellar biosynthesis protein FlhG